MTKRSWLTALPLILFVALVAAFGIALERGGGEASKFAQHVNEPAPATKIPALRPAQTVFDSKDWQRRPYLVNFFASWCVPCRSEHAGLLQLAESGVPIIGIAFKDKPATVAAFLDKEGDPYLAVADDAAGRTGIDWGVTGVPETFLIDARGMIRFHTPGPLTDTMIEDELLPLWNEVKR